uniref:Putative secreted protein n=1 Tax=Anopheles darlingi TaxID=43151 RepID=A0A2M4DIF3_ANODA
MAAVISLLFSRSLSLCLFVCRQRVRYPVPLPTKPTRDCLTGLTKLIFVDVDLEGGGTVVSHRLPLATELGDRRPET